MVPPNHPLALDRCSLSLAAAGEAERSAVMRPCQLFVGMRSVAEGARLR